MAIPVSNSVPLLVGSNNNKGTLNEEFISGLVQGSSWQFGGGPRVITYSFSLNDTPFNSYPWDSPWMASLQQAFAAWSNVANITFVESGSGTEFTQSTADLALTRTGNELAEASAIALGLFPDPNFANAFFAEFPDYSRANYPKPEGDLFFDHFSSFLTGIQPGLIGFSVLLHEIGHALGLKHVDDDGGNARPDFDSLGIGAFNDSPYTLMPSTFLSVFPGGAPFTPMLLDILAIQHIYGANLTFNTGNDTYSVGTGLKTIWDAGGTDTLDASDQPFSNTAVIDLRPGGFSGVNGAVNTVIAYGVTIENAVGGFSKDTITGNDAANFIDAGGGNDTIMVTHDDGDDTLSGGSGFDLLDFSAVNGVVQINQLGGVITGSAGNDILLDVFEQVLGTNFDDVLSGGHGGDVLDGGGGNDMFFGNNGGDLMRGGPGDDTFFFSNSDGDDRLQGGPGFDVLDYSVLDGVVQVNQLAGTTTGTAGNDTLLDVFEMVIGTAFGDVLSGGHGINSLKGGGGDDQIFANGGNDYISGGTGNDRTVMGAGNDTLDFRNGEGVDTITDFVAGGGSDDTITLKFYAGLGTTTLAGMTGAGRVAQNGAHTQITLDGGDMIILENVLHDSLHEDDFVFV